jgi:tubulin polyglutamylase TTLL6/13
MQHPHLIDGLKYDLRLYVLVLSCEPLKVYLYNDGLVRFATHKYKPIDPNADKAQLNNLFMHLTNFAVNKESEHFKSPTGTNDDTGHKRTLKKVLERLKTLGHDPDSIMGEINDVIIKTLISIQQELSHNYRTCQPADLENAMCFEMLGFDIILDEKGKAILLEVN